MTWNSTQRWRFKRSILASALEPPSRPMKHVSSNGGLFRSPSISWHCFNGLIRKKRLLSSVRIDPDTFDIALVGAEGVEIPKEALSAGERQIFAISMLWALGKTSGRDLPMIIDTPLSRLDRAHRKSLMRDYVPEASRQIILLCTDSELTPDLDKLISPFVARRYEIGVSWVIVKPA